VPKSNKNEFQTEANLIFDFVLIVFNATFINISAISWRPVSVVEEARVRGENDGPWASIW
jgi:hypothetical protein